MMSLRFNHWLAVGGLGALLISVAGLSPAHADRDYDRALRAVHHDIDVVNRDQKRLDDLLLKADDQRRYRDWRAARKTAEQIDHLRLDLRRDRENLRVDQRALDNFHRSDRGDYRRWDR